MVQQLPGRQETRLLLAPNHSLSWRGNVRTWCALALLSLIVATGMALIGAWVVLPLAGLELLALAAAIYATAHACQRQEVLTISGDDLRLEKGHRDKQAEWSLPRLYTRLVLSPGSHPESPPKLYLEHRDTTLALGDFLNRADTETLIAILERQGIRTERRAPQPTFWFWY
ncbi:MAG: DUF2244 domain-containing protein [Marinobacter sp.]|uniref:DUF2244 domain-containing protein n=1 Tax=Marinobacter sp. TaxID=50741 RepID=UPI00299D3961|nr:DUF2244 domain-containing protein [Marinobacter sp.]MDX1756156.1 DUF2244 domain-containing protein [Marinobacter sp.]